eukprot:1362962-Amorphochlora_amoeboformis.AAC.1
MQTLVFPGFEIRGYCGDLQTISEISEMEPATATLTITAADEKHLVLNLGGDRRKQTKDKGGEKKVKTIYKTPGSFEKKREKKKKSLDWTEDTVDNEFMNKKSSKSTHLTILANLTPF